jgi:hypothetical protein
MWQTGLFPLCRITVGVLIIQVPVMSIATDFPPKPAEASLSSTTQVVQQWLCATAGGERRLEYALSALDWCRRLPKLADMLPAAVWQELLEHLVQSAAGTDAANGDGCLLESNPLVHQLLAGELALTLACLFPKTKACRRLLPQARQALSAGLADLLDGKGFLHARHFDQLRPLLACWTRCRTLGNRRKHGCWSAEADKQYRQLVRNVLRLTRRDGSSVFSSGEAGSEDIAVLKAAVAMVGSKKDREIASSTLSGGKKSGGQSVCGNLPRAAIHSEWAAAAVLRPDWSRSAPRLTVLYPGKSCRVEFACGTDVLWSGDWGFDVRIDGVPASPICEWFNTCWLSDKDVDYLELEIELGEDVRLQRHFLMARKERFLFMADAVLGTRRTAIDYRGMLPLGPRMTFRQAAETCEGVLAGQKARATVIPMALPEWRSDMPSGLQSLDAKLELRQGILGSSLFAPMFFDLDQSRSEHALARAAHNNGQAAHCCEKCGVTWRQLTVAESLAVQPDDVAVGYRVAVGGKNWLIYRSLTPPRNRTLLGHNLSGEMLIARFTRKGEVKSLIEIE